MCNRFSGGRTRRPVPETGRCLAASARKRRGGFTLIEVVIALAIFVIGAIAIVRIFTPALGVIQNSGNQTIATRGSENVLARANTRTLGAPDWIYDGTGTEWDGTQWIAPTFSDLTVAFNGTANRNKSVPSNTLDIEGSALAAYKHIEGERQKVLRRTDGGGQNFVITNFPYADNVYVAIERKISGVHVSSDGTLDFSGATLDSDGSAFFDTSPPTMYSTPPPDNYRGDGNIYYISYQWIDSSGHINGVIDEPYVAKADGDYIAQVSDKVLEARNANVSASSGIVSGAVSVRLVSIATSPAIEASSGDGVRGIASGGALNGVAPGDVVYLSYTVADWRWLIEEGTPSTVAAVASPPALPVQPLSLSVPVRGLGDKNAPDPNGLYTAFMPAPNDYQVSGIDLGAWSGDGVTGDLNSVNKKTGEIVFQYDPATIVAPRARVVYSTQDGWAQQLSVAANSYVPYIPDSVIRSAGSEYALTRPGNSPRQPWREYYLDLSGTNATVLFHPGEAGKTVMVSFRDAATGKEETTIVGIDETVDASVPATFGTSLKAAKLTLINSAGDRVLTSDGITITGIQGLSVQARTAWIEGGRYAQAVATDYRKS